MEMHHFIAKDMRSGLQLVYEKLGPDALIISNKTIAEGIEIQAAIERNEDLEEAISPAPISNMQEDLSHKIRMVPETSVTNLESEIKLLRQLLETQVAQLTKQHEAYEYPIHAIIYEEMQKFGFPRAFTKNILGSLGKFNSLQDGMNFIKNILTEKLTIANNDIIKTGGIVALVGPTGVGKTTMLAKLATQYSMLHSSDDIAIINADNYRVGAREQVLTYASILGIDAYNVNTAHELENVFSQVVDKKLVLIDTSGVILQTNEIVNRLGFLKENKSLKCYLTISASASLEMLKDAINLFSYLPLVGCILTKLDETKQTGPAISQLIENDLPVAYLSTGQRVPHDFELARSASLIHQAFTTNRHHDMAFEHHEVAAC